MNFFGLGYHALRVFSVLKNRIFFLSFFYLFIINFFLNNNFLFKAIFIIFIFINFSNFFLSLNTKKNFRNSFDKIKITNY